MREEYLKTQPGSVPLEPQCEKSLTIETVGKMLDAGQNVYIRFLFTLFFALSG